MASQAVPLKEQIAGCLLGGAVGDALGAPVEFLTLAEIRRQFGTQGVRDYVPAYGRAGAITDDTQMSLFTAEGLLRFARRNEPGDVVTCVYRAYQRWYVTQGGQPRGDLGASGGLIAVPALHSRRAPGSTCLSALAGGVMGTPAHPLNTSKGCGGVMRAAPVGLLGHQGVGGRDPFRLGCEIAAATHGHPSGYLSAGFLAHVIAAIVSGEPLPPAIEGALTVLATYPGHEECRRAVERAIALARSAPPIPESVEQLGGGWVGEEALAIALFCALVANGFEDGVLLAVNHSGDSDSTGAIAGNILGAMLGTGAIPPRWLAALELRDELRQVGDQLAALHG
jgi:ADP-ribosyl-[dinitrogen reductase] hydrolase